MPGFNITGAEVADGRGIPNTTETRRKHRWYFQTFGDNKGDGSLASDFLLVLKEASRPNFTADEPEMHHNQEVIYFMGKHKWDPCKLVWYDTEQTPDSGRAAWDWLNNTIDINKMTVASATTYKKARAELVMIDGDGTTVNEKWTLWGCWPKDVNYNSLDYTVSFSVIWKIALPIKQQYQAKSASNTIR